MYFSFLRRTVRHHTITRERLFAAAVPAVLSLLILCGDVTFAGQSSPARKIVLVAGKITGHPKYTHEYEKNVILLKHLLETSPNLKGVRVEAHFQGWPQDPKTLDDADTIVLISDGADRRTENHPLYVGDRLQQLERQMQRGCGLVLFHWSTFNPSRYHDQITEWVGGYFDYETGSAPNKWYSAIKTWEGPVQLPHGEHPIGRGVRPFRVKEEFYYNLKFRPGDQRVTPIVLTRPPGETTDYAVGWAVERADGGRGFGYTGGHFYDHWWLPDYRRLILNAIAWTARADVPPQGVDSTLEEPIRALIVTGHNHPAHDWRKVTAALIAVLEQDPRLVVHVTEQPEDLATTRIADYGLLVMNYCNWDRGGLSDAAKQNFVNYLQRGGGLVLIHFANGAFTDTLPNKSSDWPEYRTRIVRRIWVHGQDQSGHDAYGPFNVRLTDAGKSHPITSGLADFDTTDELYFRQQGDLPITPLATARSKVTNQDEPMAWAYEYGAGRVFQTVLGHSDESIRKAGALIRRSAVWASKQPPLSFDPPLSLTEQVLVRDGSPWRAEAAATATEKKK
jgi:type 1 glutamine amidotransferase